MSHGVFADQVEQDCKATAMPGKRAPHTLILRKLTCTTSSQLPAAPMEAASAAAAAPLPPLVAPECTSSSMAAAAAPLLKLVVGLAVAGRVGDLGLEAGEAAGLACKWMENGGSRARD